MDKQRGRCFSIMPFEGFDEIDKIVAESAGKCRLEYRRGDHRNQPGIVMAQIVEDISDADVIVADISDNNPNVFYELGVAHQIQGPGSVVIIARKNSTCPFDISAYRHVRYQNTLAGHADLLERLTKCIEEALRSRRSAIEERWKVIRGPLERTEQIIRELHRFSASLKDLSDQTIRMSAGLGSLAISRQEPKDPKLGQDYNDGLLAERNALREALVGGATLKAMLHPPRRFTPRNLEERLEKRYRRLIGLLQGSSDEEGDSAALDLKAMGRATLVLTPVPMPHLVIIGNTIAFEGIKRGGSRGYEVTHCETDAVAVQDLINSFDLHFQECGRDKWSAARLAGELQKYLDEATQVAT